MVLKGELMVATFGKEGRGDRDRNKGTGNVSFLSIHNVTWVSSLSDNSLTSTLFQYIYLN